jgi:hypothetical protein
VLSCSHDRVLHKRIIGIIEILLDLDSTERILRARMPAVATFGCPLTALSRRRVFEGIAKGTAPGHSPWGPNMNKKLKLNLEDLQVESFNTASGPPGGGTVEGASGILWESCLFGDCCGETGACAVSYDSCNGCDTDHCYSGYPCGHTVQGSCPTFDENTCNDCPPAGSASCGDCTSAYVCDRCDP